MCFQTPTRDEGPTEYDPSKSYRIEHGSRIPWIVFNVDELITELRKFGFTSFTIIKRYKHFGGNSLRYLPKEFSEPSFPSSRTAVLAIKPEGLNQMQAEGGMFLEGVNFVAPENPVIPRYVEFSNRVWRRFNSIVRSS